MLYNIFLKVNVTLAIDWTVMNRENDATNVIKKSIATEITSLAITNKKH